MAPDDRRWAGVTPLYCESCSRGNDQHLEGFRLVSRQQQVPVPADDVGVWAATLERQPAADDRNAQQMDRARDLLWSGELSGEQLRVWEMFCDGATEREIAAAIGRSRQYIYDHHLGPLKVRCGFPPPRKWFKARKRRNRPPTN